MKVTVNKILFGLVILSLCQPYRMIPLYMGIDNQLNISSTPTYLPEPRFNIQQDNESIYQQVAPFRDFSPDPFSEVSITSEQDFYALETGLDAIHKNGTGFGVTVAILSSEIDQFIQNLTHAFTNATCTLDPNVTVDTDPWVDFVGHGTALASMVVIPTVGLVPDVKLLNVKVITVDNISSLFETGELQGNYSTVAAGIEWVLAYHPETDIILMAIPFFGGTDDLLNVMVAKATDEGILVVTPVGNQGPRYASIMSPACSPLSLSVGAAHIKKAPISLSPWFFNPQDRWFVPDYSGRGPTMDWDPGPDVIAPAEDFPITLYRTINQFVHHEVVSLTGTGAATAYVVGGLAAIYSIFYQQGHDKIRDPLGVKIALKNTAKLLFDKTFSVASQGEGLVQFKDAFNLLWNTKISPSFFTPGTTFELQGCYPRRPLGEPWLIQESNLTHMSQGSGLSFGTQTSTPIAFSGQKIRIPFTYLESKRIPGNHNVSLIIPDIGNYSFSPYPQIEWMEGSYSGDSFDQLQLLLIDYQFDYSVLPYWVDETWSINWETSFVTNISLQCFVSIPRGHIGLDYSKDIDGYWEQDTLIGRYFGWRKLLAEQFICSHPIYNLTDYQNLQLMDAIILADPELPLTPNEVQTLTLLSETNHTICILLDYNDSLHHPFTTFSRSLYYEDTSNYYQTLLNNHGIQTTVFQRNPDDFRVYPGLSSFESSLFDYSLHYVTTTSSYQNIPFNPSENIVFIPVRGYSLAITQPSVSYLIGRDSENSNEHLGAVTTWSNGLFVVCGTDAPFALSYPINTNPALDLYVSNCTAITLAFSDFLLYPRLSPNIRLNQQHFPSMLLGTLTLTIEAYSSTGRRLPSSSIEGVAAVTLSSRDSTEDMLWSGPFTITKGKFSFPVPEFYSGMVTIRVRVQSEVLADQWVEFQVYLPLSPFLYQLVSILSILVLIGVCYFLIYWFRFRTPKSSLICPRCQCTIHVPDICPFCLLTLKESDDNKL